MTIYTVEGETFSTHAKMLTHMASIPPSEPDPIVALQEQVTAQQATIDDMLNTLERE